MSAWARCSRCSSAATRRFSSIPGRPRRPPGAPPWWGALTGYVAAMQTAWFAFAAWGRPAHPGLPVCFAMLAGLAPLHRERLMARGGSAPADRHAFLDISSYGDRAVDAVVREIGVDQLVFGSDRPVIAPRGADARRRRAASRSASAIRSGC